MPEVPHPLALARPGAPVVLVEHMEEEPTRWLIAEYAEASREAWRRGIPLVVTGARDPRLQALLDREGVAWTWGTAAEHRCPDPSIVLDLRAKRRLEPWEAGVARCIIVGGIMGDHPPRGRGMLLVYSLPGYAARNLGPVQMSIHTAVWAAVEVARGRSLSELSVGWPARFTVRTYLGEAEVELPYAYPLGPDGRPVVPERIRRLLERGVVWDEDYQAG